MAVRIGSARIDENGQVHGGKAGDQTGKEVSTQSWYQHRKGWLVLRPKSSADAENIATCMQKACNSARIGYDQWQRNTLYNAIKEHDFDIDQLRTNVETDCSALVRVCCAYAGIMVDDFNTTSEARVLMATKKFTLLKSSKYTTTSAYLVRGDILVTLTQGHTVVVLSDGNKVTRPKCYQGALSLPAKGYIQKGDTGTYVKNLQKFLNWYGAYDLDLDGIFGELTESAVESFQRRAGGLVVDGVFGKKSLAKAKAVKK